MSASNFAISALSSCMSSLNASSLTISDPIPGQWKPKRTAAAKQPIECDRDNNNAQREAEDRQVKLGEHRSSFR